ncbi:hypothetical protein PG993_007033, partial [Apiospora rasikravindrae]
MGSFDQSSLKGIPPFLASITLLQWIALAGAVLITHTLISYGYNAYFHPLSKYPGPRLASVSSLWEIYFLCTGKWPWAIENALKRYGDVVRTGPNSLVFMKPQAVTGKPYVSPIVSHMLICSKDIHGPKRNLQGTFVKTAFVDGLGDEDDGLLWERDPEKHRRIAKKMSPAFSGNSLRAKEPTMHKHIDLMMRRLEEHVKNHPFLDSMEAVNFLVVIMVATKTYPILGPVVLLLVPWRVVRSLPRLIGELRKQIVGRIGRRQNLEHSDYFEQLLPANEPVAKEDRRIRHMLTVTGQLIVGGYDPTSFAIYMMFYYLLQSPDSLEQLKQEIRGAFSCYESITSDELRGLPWLNACLSETLRLSAAATHHSLPRLSPGAVVGGDYIPKGVLCRTSLFAYSRNDRFFHEPRSFKPERWLSQDHPMYNAVFATDDRSAHFPFIIGPRQCPGREVAKMMLRLVVAKMFWLFDVEQVSGKLDFDKDFRVYGMWQKPELRVRLVKRRKMAIPE